MITGSNYLPPQSVWVTSKVPYFNKLRSVYRPYGPLQGLGQVFESNDPGIRYARPGQFYRPWTSLRPSGAPLVGLGATANTPVLMDVRWWGRTLATAGLTFAALYVLAKL